VLVYRYLFSNFSSINGTSVISFDYENMLIVFLPLIMLYFSYRSRSFVLSVLTLAVVGLLHGLGYISNVLLFLYTIGCLGSLINSLSKRE